MRLFTTWKDVCQIEWKYLMCQGQILAIYFSIFKKLKLFVGFVGTRYQHVNTQRVLLYLYTTVLLLTLSIRHWLFFSIPLQKINYFVSFSHSNVIYPRLSVSPPCKVFLLSLVSFIHNSIIVHFVTFFSLSLSKITGVA